MSAECSDTSLGPADVAAGGAHLPVAGAKQAERVQQAVLGVAVVVFRRGGCGAARARVSEAPVGRAAVWCFWRNRRGSAAAAAAAGGGRAPPPRCTGEAIAESQAAGRRGAAARQAGRATTPGRGTRHAAQRRGSGAGAAPRRRSSPKAVRPAKSGRRGGRRTPHLASRQCVPPACPSLRRPCATASTPAAKAVGAAAAPWLHAARTRRLLSGRPKRQGSQSNAKRARRDCTPRHAGAAARRAGRARPAGRPAVREAARGGRTRRRGQCRGPLPDAPRGARQGGRRAPCRSAGTAERSPQPGVTPRGARRKLGARVDHFLAGRGPTTRPAPVSTAVHGAWQRGAATLHAERTTKLQRRRVANSAFCRSTLLRASHALMQAAASTAWRRCRPWRAR